MIRSLHIHLKIPEYRKQPFSSSNIFRQHSLSKISYHEIFSIRIFRSSEAETRGLNARTCETVSTSSVRIASQIVHVQNYLTRNIFER